MEILLIIIKALFVFLFILLIKTIIKYPKDILQGLFSFITPDVLKPIIENEDSNLSEKPYASTLNLSFNYHAGNKYIFFTGDPKLISPIIKSFPDYKPEDFTFFDESLIKCPDNITFYDFSILVQHFWSESKLRSYGIFLSEEIRFFIYQDERTLHNLIGKTHDGSKFSVYTLDDLDNNIYLRVNKNIRVDEFDIGKSEVFGKSSKMIPF